MLALFLRDVYVTTDAADIYVVLINFVHEDSVTYQKEDDTRNCDDGALSAII